MELLYLSNLNNAIASRYRVYNAVHARLPRLITDGDQSFTAGYIAGAENTEGRRQLSGPLRMH